MVKAKNLGISFNRMKSCTKVSDCVNERLEGLTMV